MIENDNKPGENSPADTLESSNGATGAYDGKPDDLHDLFGTATLNDEEDPLAALRNDPNYSALITELEYIAKQARLLFEPAQEAPSDEVWKKIQSELAKDEPEA